MSRVAKLAKEDALRWLAENYDVDPAQAYRNMLDYISIFDKSEELLTTAFGEDRDEVAAQIIHEVVEATEIKKRFGYVPKHESLTWTSEEYLYAHPIALKYEFKYLEDVGRTDVIERRKMMISAAQKLLTKEGGEM